MNRKRHIDSWFRGWLPKEPTFTTNPNAVDPKNSPLVKALARALVAGNVVSALLGVFGSLAGLDHGAGVYAWPAFTCSISCAAVGVTAVWFKRKTKRQRRAEAWVR